MICHLGGTWSRSFGCARAAGLQKVPLCSKHKASSSPPPPASLPSLPSSSPGSACQVELSGDKARTCLPWQSGVIFLCPVTVLPRRNHVGERGLQTTSDFKKMSESLTVSQQETSPGVGLDRRVGVSGERGQESHARGGGGHLTRHSSPLQTHAILKLDKVRGPGERVKSRRPEVIRGLLVSPKPGSSQWGCTVGWVR